MAYHFYPWNRKHAKILSPQLLTECRPLSHTSACRPLPQAPAIYREQEEASGFSPTLVLLPPGPQPLPFEAVMLGITDYHSLPSPFPEVPSFFPRFSILGINVKKHSLPSPPV